MEQSKIISIDELAEDAIKNPKNHVTNNEFFFDPAIDRMLKIVGTQREHNEVKVISGLVLPEEDRIIDYDMCKCELRGKGRSLPDTRYPYVGLIVPKEVYH